MGGGGERDPTVVLSWSLRKVVEHRGSTVQVASMLDRGFAKWHNCVLQDTQLKVIE